MGQRPCLSFTDSATMLSIRGGHDTHANCNLDIPRLRRRLPRSELDRARYVLPRSRGEKRAQAMTGVGSMEVSLQRPVDDVCMIPPPADSAISVIGQSCGQR